MIGRPLADSVTEVRDLHSGVPIWARYPKPSLPTGALTSSMRTDVVVVGAGITGALVAEAAAAMGLATVVLDRRPPAHGSTAASTALLQFEIDTPLIRLAEESAPTALPGHGCGLSGPSPIWRTSSSACSIACAFRPRRALYLAGNELDATALGGGMPSTPCHRPAVGVSRARATAGVCRLGSRCGPAVGRRCRCRPDIADGRPAPQRHRQRLPAVHTHPAGRGGAAAAQSGDGDHRRHRTRSQGSRVCDGLRTRGWHSHGRSSALQHLGIMQRRPSPNACAETAISSGKLRTPTSTSARRPTGA